MGTRLSFNYTKSKYSNIKHDFEEPFYCIESPSEVLHKLISKYHVQSYNSVMTQWCDVIAIPSDEDSLTNLATSIKGLIIKPYDTSKNGLTITKSVDDFSPKVPNSDFSIKNARRIVEEMIRRYLVDVKIIDYGFVTNGTREVISKGKQEAISYLDSRKTAKNLFKEQNLEDILAYGKAVLGQSFNEKAIEIAASIVVRSVPKEFDPRSGSYQILRL